MDFLLVLLLIIGKKPFWVNHLKLAELREIELNSYVQRLIKLPIHVCFVYSLSFGVNFFLNFIDFI